MQAELLNCPTGQFSLVRPGTPSNMPLRAWDAADEYLIEHIIQNFPNQSVTILNDGFGALGVALATNANPEHQNNWITDSFCALQAIKINLDANSISPLPNVLSVNEKWQVNGNLWLVKIPKNTSYLEFQLQKIAKVAAEKGQEQTILLAGMMKHLPKTLLQTLEKYGEAIRAPFKKKAMLVHLTIQADVTLPVGKYPKQHNFFKTKVIGQANVFGRDKLDHGTELLLNNMPTISGDHKVADLCCGTGIIGLNHALRNPQAEVSFFDESHMAVDCAKQGLHLNELDNSAHFYWDDGMKQAESESFDLILCNPPFHEQHAVGDHIAWRLFQDAFRCLKKGGKFIIVGNRHLGYHTKLKRIFNNAENIAANNKFVVLQSVKN